MKLGLWNEGMKNKVIAANGSIQDIEEIPENIRNLYRTVWEMSMKDILDMAADRGAYICQSQSLNLFMQNPNFGKLTSMHFYAWKKGLKTGMYYLRTKAAVDAIKFTVDAEMRQKKQEEAKVAAEAEVAAVAQPAVALEPQASYGNAGASDISPVNVNDPQSQISCSLDNPDDCEMCGS